MGVRAIAIPTDLADEGQVKALAEAAEREFESIDILVNNAGIERTAPYETYPLDEITAAVEINLLAPMRLTRAVLPGMLERGRGHILNMSSLAGKIGYPRQTPYATTKAALVMFTRSLQAELVDRPVSISVICPGFVADSGMYARREAVRGATPKLLMPTTTSEVVSAVMKTLKGNGAEVIVNPLPVRPLVVLTELFPGIIPQVHKSIGLSRLTTNGAAVRKLGARDVSDGMPPFEPHL